MKLQFYFQLMQFSESTQFSKQKMALLVFDWVKIDFKITTFDHVYKLLSFFLLISKNNQSILIAQSQ